MYLHSRVRKCFKHHSKNFMQYIVCDPLHILDLTTYIETRYYMGKDGERLIKIVNHCEECRDIHEKENKNKKVIL